MLCPLHQGDARAANVRHVKGTKGGWGCSDIVSRPGGILEQGMSR